MATRAALVVVLARQAAAASSTPAPPPPPCSPPCARVAFIGNSYTYWPAVGIDIPGMFKNLSASAGIEVHTGQAIQGGSSLYMHADTSTGLGQTTQRMLSDPSGWDFVVMQDESETPGGERSGNFPSRPAGEGRNLSLAAMTAFYAPLIAAANATAVMYQTWGRHDGDPGHGYADFMSMTARTAAGYAAYAAALSASGTPPPATAPCGAAWEMAYNQSADPLSDTSNFSCLYANGGPSAGTAPPCPINGAGKGGHESLLGTYLNACVMFARLHNRSPVGLAWTPDVISADARSWAQQLAHRAWQRDSGVWPNDSAWLP